jgi:hypothetical protein
MEEKNRAAQNFSQSEIDLIKRLRQQPQMRERVQRILEIANSTEGPLKTADEIEELLLEEMRRLGNNTMTEWATQAEKRVGEELQQQDPTVLKRKKKRSVGGAFLASLSCLNRSGGVRPNLICARWPDDWASRHAENPAGCNGC